MPSPLRIFTPRSATAVAQSMLLAGGAMRPVEAASAPDHATPMTLAGIIRDPGQDMQAVTAAIARESGRQWQRSQRGSPTTRNRHGWKRRASLPLSVMPQVSSVNPTTRLTKEHNGWRTPPNARTAPPRSALSPTSGQPDSLASNNLANPSRSTSMASIEWSAPCRSDSLGSRRRWAHAWHPSACRPRASSSEPPLALPVAQPDEAGNFRHTPACPHAEYARRLLAESGNSASSMARKA